MDFIAEHSYRKMTLEEAFQACLKSSLLKTIKRKSDPCYHGSTADQGFQLWLVNDVPFCLVEVNQVYPVRGWRRFSVHAQVWSLTKSNLYFLYFFIWKNNGCFKLFYGHQKQKQNPQNSSPKILKLNSFSQKNSILLQFFWRSHKNL